MHAPRSLLATVGFIMSGEALEVLQHIRDQRLPARVLPGRRRGKELEQVAHLLGGVAPTQCRGGNEMGFQLVLTNPQRPFVGLDFGEEPPQLGRLLGHHAAVSVKLDGSVGHVATSRRAAASRSSATLRSAGSTVTISTEEGWAAGTKIMV